MAVQGWQELAAQKRAERDSKIPQKWRLPAETLDTISQKKAISVLHVPRKSGILSPKELEITEKYDATGLLEKMASRELSASEVALAFCKRAAIAQQLTFCLTEIFFDMAIERAKFLDEYIEKEGKPLGPLHGLPISLKDPFNVKGIDSTMGYVSFIRKPPATFNSPLVDILLSAGAILYVKTNIPQTLLTGDTENNIFGRTLNPHNLSLTVGGSTGGEGALIALRGSLLGVGTDLGGSIRIPAMCCGIYGFKPSPDRIPYGGLASPIKEGCPGISVVAGPLATSVRDLRLFMETVIRSSSWELDSTAFPMPWQEVPKKETLTIGVIIQDPGLPVTPPVTRTLYAAAEKLKAVGHNVIMLEKFPSMAEGWELSREFGDLDNEVTHIKYIHDGGEPFVNCVKSLWAPIPGGRINRTLEDVYRMHSERSKIQDDWHNLFVSSKLDVILCPGHTSTAVPHDTYGRPPYTKLFNMLNSAAAMLPFGKVDKSIDIHDLALPQYDPEAVDGAPCAVQVVGRPYYEEATLSAIQVIDDVLKM